MKFSIAIIVAAATSIYAAAVPAPEPQGGICFDNFDCILSGFNCVNFQCVSGSSTSSGAAASATGAFCFDAGDCLLNGGGQCVSNKCTK